MPHSAGAPLRVGIVGSGFGGAVHAPAFSAHPRFEVTAIASPNRAAQVARERGIPNAFAGVEAMLAGAELDVVSVAAPPFAHRDAVLQALERGLHVLCEKPFALSVAQAAEMAAAAKTAGVACAVAHEFRFTPARQAQKELIGNGHLGALRQIEIALLNGSLRAESVRPRSWWFERSRGGGVAGALLSHLIDSATWLAGRAPVRTFGLLRTANARRSDASGEFVSDVDDGAFATLDYGAGLIARLSADATAAVESFTLAAHGEARTAVASGPNLIATTLFAVDADETSELELKPPRYAKLASIHPNLPPFVELLDEFAEAIAGRPNAAPTFEEALETQRVLEALGYGVTGA